MSDYGLIRSAARRPRAARYDLGHKVSSDLSGLQLKTESRRLLMPEGSSFSVDLQDGHGFLNEGVAYSLSHIDSVFDEPVTVILAPPGYGKSHEARQAWTHLSDHQSVFGEYIHETSFDKGGTKEAVLPGWWSRWSQDAKARACWIVDAIDEDPKGSQTFAILKQVRSLKPAARQRLALVMFCRENEFLRSIRNELTEIYAPDPERGIVRLLAPITEDIARVIAGGEEALHRVREIIRLNRLQQVARFPAVIRCLANLPAQARITTPEVWRTVLTRMLLDRHAEVEALNWPDEKSCFFAAKRLAACMALSGTSEIAETSAAGLPNTLSDLFQQHIPEFSSYRRAASFVLKSSVCKPTADGYRFAQRHIQEWFAAFAFEDVPLARLRTLFVDQQGRLIPEYQGILALLAQVSHHEEVRAWIPSLNDGVPLFSDAAPMTLDHAVETLDGLVAIANRAPFGLGTHRGRALAGLAVHGLGKIVAARLKDETSSPAAKDLLLDVAGVLCLAEAVPIAQDLVRDETENDLVRSSAVYLLEKLATREQIQAISTVAEQIPGDRRSQAVFHAGLLSLLHKSGVWSMAQVTRVCRDVDGSTDHLVFRLQDAMKLSDAREIVREFDWMAAIEAEHARTTTTKRRVHEPAGKLALGLGAIKLLVKAPALERTDYELLMPAVLALSDAYSRNLFREFPSALLELFKQDKEARRALYRVDLDTRIAAASTQEGFIRHVLEPADASWLADQCRALASTPDWLWDTLLNLGYRSKDTPEGTDAQIFLNERIPDRVKEFSARAEKNRAEYDKFLAEEAARKRRKKTGEYEITKLITSILENPKGQPYERTLAIAQICFVPDGHRPSNLLGTWADVPVDLKERVRAAVVEGLRLSKPPALSEEGAPTRNTFYLSYAFAWAASNAPEVLSPDLIRTWLPTLLHWSDPLSTEARRVCHAANETATEDVILERIGQEARGELIHTQLAGRLSENYWSPRLIDAVVRLLNDEAVGPGPRASLLRSIARRAPTHALPLARSALTSTSREYKTAAIDALLVLDPSRALAELRSLSDDGRIETLKSLETLNRERLGRDRIASWPAGDLEALYLLLDELPAENDDDDFSWTTGTTHRMKWSILNVLWDRQGDDDLAAIQRIAATRKPILDWFENQKSRQAAGALLESIVPTETDPDAYVPAAAFLDVVRILDQVTFRLIRSAGDLAMVVAEEIRAIATDALDHVSMLYQPIKKGDTKRQQLREEALQAYVACRLSDRLPGRVLKDAKVHREGLAARNHRTDLRIEAVTIERHIVSIIIEVKWSENDSLLESLRDQLGDDYLETQNLTHGIYVVGWLRPKARIKSAASLGKILEAQANEYRARPHGRVIVPLVLDLSWPYVPPKKGAAAEKSKKPIPTKPPKKPGSRPHQGKRTPSNRR